MPRRVETAEAETHAGLVGKLLSNLQTLEFLMRLYLVGPDELGFEMFSLKTGDRVPSGPMTNYDSLDQVRRRYNEHVAPEERVSDWNVTLRDALAHGRLVSNQPAGPMRLFKFDRPATDGSVLVLQSWTLDEDWLGEQVQNASDDIDRVRRALEESGTAT